MAAKFFVVGLGSKARQGKDTCAQYAKELYPNVHIIHFADALYEECKNESRRHNLIEYTGVQDNGDVYLFLEAEAGNKFRMVFPSEMPRIHELFQRRGIKFYPGMNEKDGEILQIWGTDFRRTIYGNNYWVERTHDKIKEIMKQYEGAADETIVWIFIPDARFKNEAAFIRDTFGKRGWFIKVERYNEDGTRFFTTDRDNNHPSEIDLDDVESDTTLQAKNVKELQEVFKQLTEEMIARIE